MHSRGTTLFQHPRSDAALERPVTPGWRSRLLERLCEHATAVHLSARKGIPQLRLRALAVYDTRSLFPQTPEARLWTVFVNAFLSIQLRLLCRGHSTCVKT